MNLRTLGAIALFVGAPATVFAFHNHLTKSAPAVDESVSTPKQIRLWFAEKVEPKFSSVTLLKPDSTKIEVSKPRATDDAHSIVADVTGPLTPGSYTIVWRTAGDDGHAVRGKYSFSVK